SRRTAMDTARMRMRLLLVETEIVLQAAVTVLLATDCQVDIASTAAEGVRRVIDAAPDLVVWNTFAPDVADPWFWHTLRDRLPTCPVIVLTAADGPEILREVSGLQMIEGICHTPLEVGTLLEQIHMVCARRGQQLSLRLPLRLSIGRVITHINRFYPT